MYYSLWDIAETIEVKMMAEQTDIKEVSIFNAPRKLISKFNEKVKASQVVFFNIALIAGYLILNRRQ